MSLLHTPRLGHADERILGPGTRHTLVSFVVQVLGVNGTGVVCVRTLALLQFVQMRVGRAWFCLIMLLSCDTDHFRHFWARSPFWDLYEFIVPRST